MRLLFFIPNNRKNKKFFLNLILFIVFILTTNLYFFSDMDETINTISNSIDLQSSNEPKKGKLAIIIDDFGQNRDGVYEMMAIKKHLTFAIMPFLEFSVIDAKNAYNTKHEVIVHLPMESNKGKLSWVGPRPILSSMSNDEIQDLIDDCINNIPHAVGANNHMGAKASGNERVMSFVLDKILERNMYFVDSRTTRKPIGKKIADSIGVKCYDRNVFLDGKKSKKYIKDRLRLAGEIALEKGLAVAIGHVGTEGGVVTAEAISEMLEEFEEKNIELVYVSELEK